MVGIYSRRRTTTLSEEIPPLKVLRRTDLLSKVHRPEARYSRIDGTFYNQAMARYRCLFNLYCFFDKFPSPALYLLQRQKVFRVRHNNVDQRVLFLAASDDPKWLKENLQGVDNDLYFSVDLFGLVEKITCTFFSQNSPKYLLAPVDCPTQLICTWKIICVP